MKLGSMGNANHRGSAQLVACPVTLATAVFAALWAASALAIQTSVPAPKAAQNEGVAALFPEPRQVTSSYSDDPSRYAALDVLYTTLEKKAPAPGSQAASQKLSAYYTAMREVDLRYFNQPLNSPVLRDYQSRRDTLKYNPKFKSEVLERYRLANLPEPIQRSIPGPGGSPRSAEPAPSLQDLAMQTGAPYWLGTLMAMAAMPTVIVLLDGLLRGLGSLGAEGNHGPLQLPESLRVIKVPAKRYAVEMESGLVIEEKTWAEAHVSVGTTGGGSYMQGGQWHSAPVQTYTSSSVVQKDRVWVRTLDGRETAWTFSGGSFVTGQAQIVSAIQRRLRNGSMDFLLAYNHSTGQFTTFDGIQNAHIVPKRLVWWATTALGVPGYLWGVAMVYRRLAGSLGVLALRDPSHLIIGFIGSAIFASVFVGITRRVFFRRRNSHFSRRYLPAFREFFQQSTPALRQRLTPS